MVESLQWWKKKKLHCDRRRKKNYHENSFSAGKFRRKEEEELKVHNQISNVILSGFVLLSSIKKTDKMQKESLR